jgi:hypothetical protein
MRIRVAACLLVLLVGSAGCSKSESDTSSHAPATTKATAESIPQTGGETIPVANSDWRAVIDDWYDNGVFDKSHSCRAVRTAIERLPRSSRIPPTVFEDLGRYEARGCRR